MRKRRLRGFGRIVAEIQGVARNLRRTKSVEGELDPYRRRGEKLERLLDTRLHEMVKNYHGVKIMNENQNEKSKLTIDDAETQLTVLAHEMREAGFTFGLFVSPPLNGDHSMCSPGRCVSHDESSKLVSITNGNRSSCFNIVRALAAVYGEKVIADALKSMLVTPIQRRERDDAPPFIVLGGSNNEH